MAKLFASEVALQAPLEAMRIHGGYGYSTEFEVERLYRDAPLMIIGEGTNDILRIVIAKALHQRRDGGSDERQPRIYLYVPGNAPDKLDKALTRGADALIVDLEDAVPVARARTRARRRSPPGSRRASRPAPTELWVRVNPGATGDDDVRAARRAARAARARPRQGRATPRRSPRSPGMLADARRRDDASHAAAGVRRSGPGRADDRPRARVHRLQIGEVDLAPTLGLTPAPDERN